MKNLTLILFLLISIVSYSQTITPIADIKQNDSNGVPIDTGKVFTVTGIVTSSNQFGNDGPGSIQDQTGGISIYGSFFANAVNIGDSVIVTAVLSQYKGLTELESRNNASVQVISHSHPLHPIVVTVSQIINQQWNGFEAFEGKLIRINNVSIKSSGNFSGNMNYNITDNTASLTNGFRIDADVSSIIGTAIPSGKVDLIGILGQYKYSAPYNSGYQLLPRFIEDIVDNGKPLILSPILAADIDTNSFTVYFKTARNGNSKIKYGLTAAMELDSLVINDDTTSHKITVKGLKPATTYFYKVYSTNVKGTSVSDLQSATTASANPSVGAINVYFNFPVDTSVAIPGNAAHGNVNFQQKLINRINRAKSSIDLAVYSFFGLPNVADALVVAKNRGVRIRVVYDSRTTQDDIRTLMNAGIKISKRPASLPGIMHDKFFIFDARDTIATNDWLWTGSWNVTSTELGWKNNVVEINDPTITKAYQKEFEEMWGSNTDTPNPSNAKFSYQKTDNIPHSFSIGGREVELYFSPTDGTTSHIISAINSANDNIYFAQFMITRNNIATALYNKYTSGVQDIRGVVNTTNASGSEYSYLSTFADMHQNPPPTLHDKYGIIDATDGSSDPIVITGSHNWTNSAETINDENTIFIHDLLIANQYMQDFKKRYNEAGGTATFIIPTSVDDNFNISKFSYHLYQNYPNPFNPITTIRFEIPKSQHIELEVYNILGEKVRTLFNGEAPAGIMTVDFNGDNLASGIYIYHLEADNFTAAKKLILLK